MSESYPEVTEGCLDEAAIVIDCIADELIEMWSPVILVAAGSGEDMPRVEPINIAKHVDVIGVAVGPLRDEANNRCAKVAGEIIQVCVFGRCKVRVDGTVNIGIGDGLVTHDTDGVAEKVDYQVAQSVPGTPTDAEMNFGALAIAAVFAKALKASTADLDIIPCFVRPNVGDSV